MGEVSRQQVYQDRHREKGLCILCPEPIYLGGVHCKLHTIANRIRNRAKSGSKPWKLGGPGRPPKGKQAQQTGQNRAKLARKEAKMVLVRVAVLPTDPPSVTGALYGYNLRKVRGDSPLAKFEEEK